MAKKPKSKGETVVFDAENPTCVICGGKNLKGKNFRDMITDKLHDGISCEDCGAEWVSKDGTAEGKK